MWEAIKQRTLFTRKHAVQVSLNPPVKVIVVVLCLSPEVEKHQRQAESRHEQSKGGSLQLSAARHQTLKQTFSSHKE